MAKIITTPMCEEIVKLAGIDDYIIDKNPDNHKGDLAIVLSESSVEMDSIAIKINTAGQIFESIKLISKDMPDEEILSFFKDYPLCRKYLNSSFKWDINVKVYSEFLKDIVLDVGFNIVSKDFDYVRVDFYNLNGKIYFGELTFIHGGGFEKFYPSSKDLEWGEYWN